MSAKYADDNIIFINNLISTYRSLVLSTLYYIIARCSYLATHTGRLYDMHVSYDDTYLN